MPLQKVKDRGLSDEDMGFGATPAATGLSDEDMGFAKNPSEARVAKSKIGMMDMVRGVIDAGIPGAAAIRQMGGSPEAIGRGAVDSVTMGSLGYIPAWKQQMDEDSKEYPKSSIGGRVVGAAGLGFATGGLGEALPVIKGVSTAPVLMGGAQGFLEKPAGDNSLKDDLLARINNAKNGLFIGGATQVGGALSGKAGDWLMQKAVGRTKYTPGVGTELADQGIVGMRGMMKGQVNRAADRVGGEIGSAAANAPGMGSAQPAADRVRGVVKNIDISNPSVLDIDKINVVNGVAHDIDQRGMQTWADMLRRRKAAGERVPEGAWASLNPATFSAISKAEQQGYSTSLKAGVPELQRLDPQYAALAKARSALSKDPSIGKALLTSGGGAGAAATAGYFLHGKEGAEAGALAGLAGGLGNTAAAKSVGGQALVKGSQMSPAISAAIIDYMARKKREQQ